MAYTHEQMLEKMQQASTEMNLFYQQVFVNYQGYEKGIGKTKGISYSEDIAAFLLDNLNLFDSISILSKTSSYKSESHDGRTENQDSCRAEERISMGMFGNIYENIGHVIDYQTILSESLSDKNAVKIDVISETDNEIWLIELKKYDSDETLLRCVIEAYTNYKLIDQSKLRQDFQLDDKKAIRVGVIVFRDQEQHENYKKADTKVSKLMQALDVHLFVIAKENKEYQVDPA